MVKEAIVLAGGLGTRLRKIVKDVPKPMADINGKPFLEYLLLLLKEQGIERVVLAVGYKYKIIRNHFGHLFEGLEIIYSIEKKQLLGTGGAIRKSLQFVENDYVLILNGDTFFNINIRDFYYFHKVKKSLITLALKPMKNISRYGVVEVDEDNKIRNFKEKKFYKSGLINGGVYLLDKKFYLSLTSEGKFSFEKDFLEKKYLYYDFYGFISDQYFIDIGVPDDYIRARVFFQKFKKF